MFGVKERKTKIQFFFVVSVFFTFAIAFPIASNSILFSFRFIFFLSIFEHIYAEGMYDFIDNVNYSLNGRKMFSNERIKRNSCLVSRRTDQNRSENNSNRQEGDEEREKKAKSIQWDEQSETWNILDVPTYEEANEKRVEKNTQAKRINCSFCIIKISLDAYAIFNADVQHITSKLRAEKKKLSNFTK